MRYKVIGVEDVNYESKRSGKRIVGKKLVVCYDPQKKGFEGLQVLIVFCNSDVLGVQSDFLDKFVHLNYVPSAYGKDRFDLASVEIIEEG